MVYAPLKIGLSLMLEMQVDPFSQFLVLAFQIQYLVFGNWQLFGNGPFLCLFYTYIDILGPLLLSSSVLYGSHTFNSGYVSLESGHVILVGNANCSCFPFSNFKYNICPQDLKLSFTNHNKGISLTVLVKFRERRAMIWNLNLIIHIRTQWIYIDIFYIISKSWSNIWFWLASNIVFLGNFRYSK